MKNGRYGGSENGWGVTSPRRLKDWRRVFFRLVDDGRFSNYVACIFQKHHDSILFLVISCCILVSPHLRLLFGYLREPPGMDKVEAGGPKTCAERAELFDGGRVNRSHV